MGLPLSLSLVEAGLRVGIFDIDGAALERIAGGQMPFLENGADELLPRVLATGRLEMDTSAAMIARADAVILVIGTPVDEFLGPSMRVFERAVDQIAPHVADGALVVLRSTVYPGTTEYVAAAFKDRGLQGGRRVLPGADRRGPRARGDPQPAPDHRRGRAAGRRPRGGAVRAASPRRRSARAPRRPSSPSCSPTPGAT